MPLPAFNEFGDLPEGVYQAPLAEILARFGSGTVMREEFRSEGCPEASSVLFDHARADDELGASIFWVRPEMLLGEPIDEFLAFWQKKRDGRRRGIVEVTP